MKLWAANYVDGDGYTYWGTITLAICDSREKADEICLNHYESKQYKMENDLENYEVVEVELNSLWQGV